MTVKIYFRSIILISAVGLFLIAFSASAQLPQIGPPSIPAFLASIADFIFKLVIPLATIVIIWSGILFITAGGNEERIKKARAWFLWALLGLIVALIGMGFVNLIKEILGTVG